MRVTNIRIHNSLDRVEDGVGASLPENTLPH